MSARHDGGPTPESDVPGMRPDGSGFGAADAIAEMLGLEPLPGEGGRYRETFRSQSVLPVIGADGSECFRSAGTAIYYLLSDTERSGVHSVPFPEIWHHYAGSAVEISMTSPDGETRTCVLGDDLAAGQRPQVIVPAGWLQTARIACCDECRSVAAERWALTGTTMSPGFDFEDWRGGR